MYVYLSVTISRPNRCTNFNTICHEDTLILVEGHKLLLTAIIVIHAGGVASKSQCIIN